MKRAFLAATLAIGATVASLVSAVPASAQVIVVLPGESIHAAVQSAQPGDTIQLAAGVYEDVVVVKTNGITIQGVGSGTEGTILRPPADPPGRCFGGVGGICILGNFQDGTRVAGVTITGIRAEGFAEAGFIAILTRNTTFEGNAGIDGGGYGLAAFETAGITMRDNFASGNGFAGLYVGDSRRANATIEGNEAFDNVFGVFLRDAARGDVVGNVIHDNCIGILVLETPSPIRAGRFSMLDNTIRRNNAFCPGGGGGQPSTSGTGIAIAGGRGNTIEGNVIARNRPSRDVPFHGGVVLVELDGAEPIDNTVIGNTLTRNRPNVFTDGSGSGNVIEGNVCTPDC
jgi:parallel beta-helix repeat protein